MSEEARARLEGYKMAFAELPKHRQEEILKKMYAILAKADEDTAIDATAAELLKDVEI